VARPESRESAHSGRSPQVSGMQCYPQATGPISVHVWGEQPDRG